MLLAILAIAALAPGLATAWTLRDRGWAIAVLAAVGITAALPLVLLASLLAFPPLGLIVSAASAVAALRGYDDGSLVVATAWAAMAVTATACTGWPL